MQRETSLYLDLIRFCAALTVFCAHAGGQRLTEGFLWQVGPLGDEAVMVFFVLSGFVIGYVTDRRETSAAVFGLNRAARLYSVVVPALMLTAVLDNIGRSLHPDYYAPWWGYQPAHVPLQFLRALTFTNKVWAPIGGPGSDLPFWSLGYEVAYYVIFGIAIFAPAGWRILGVGVALILAGPDVVSLFPIWLLGVGCYHACTRLTIKRADGVMLMVCPLLLWIAYEVYMWHHGRTILQGDALLRQDYIVGPLFAAQLVGFHAMAPHVGGLLNRLALPIRWLAGATFSIYLFHLPIMQFLTTVTPWNPGAWQNRMLMIPGVLVIVFALAEISERRKNWWRSAFDLLLRRLRMA